MIPELVQVIALRSELVAKLINDKLDMARIFMVLGYTGYFVLGYYLNKITIKKKTEIIIYVLGLIGLIFTIVMTALLSNSKGEADILFYNNLTVNVLVMSMAVFVFFKNHANKYIHDSERYKKRLQLISRCSLGVYLIHVIIIKALNLWFGFNSLSINPIISVPLIAIIVFVISYIISVIVYKIPKIGKWIM